MPRRSRTSRDKLRPEIYKLWRKSYNGDFSLVWPEHTYYPSERQTMLDSKGVDARRHGNTLEGATIIMDSGRSTSVTVGIRNPLWASVAGRKHEVYPSAHPSVLAPVYLIPKQPPKYGHLGQVVMLEDTAITCPDLETKGAVTYYPNIHGWQWVNRALKETSVVYTDLPVQNPAVCWVVRKGCLVIHSKPWPFIGFDPTCQNLDLASFQWANKLKSDPGRWHKLHLAQVGYFSTLLSANTYLSFT